jgi:hypothetical protein
MLIFAASNVVKKMKQNILRFKMALKSVRDDFTVTPNQFNQNLNYEKILRFSSTKVQYFFHSPNLNSSLNVNKCYSSFILV